MKLVKIQNSGKLDGLHMWFTKESKKKNLTVNAAINGASLDSLQMNYEVGSKFNMQTDSNTLNCKVTSVLDDGKDTIYLCKATSKTV